MKKLLFFLFVVNLFSQEFIDFLPDEVPYQITEPKIPSLNILFSTVNFDYTLLEIKNIKSEGHKIIKYHYYEGDLYNGWAKMIFDNSHKYRFVKIENGLITWQIGYFDDGNIDHDFHMKNGINLGSQRMWTAKDMLYIQNFFVNDGKLHGIQKRWHSNGNLAYEANYDYGKLLSEISYDLNGVIIKD